MSLIQKLNESFEKLPSISRDLEVAISKQDWPLLKQQQAAQIVSQLNTYYNLLFVPQTGANILCLKNLKLHLTPHLCGIEKGHKFQMVTALKEYLEELLKDLNRISSEVKFSLEGYDASDCDYYTACYFSIKWDF